MRSTVTQIGASVHRARRIIGGQGPGEGGNAGALARRRPNPGHVWPRPQTDPRMAEPSGIKFHDRR